MKLLTTGICLVLYLCLPNISAAQSEPFTLSELNLRPGGSGNYRLAHPFEIIYGPDNYLYITEKIGRVVRVDTGTGVRQVILDHRANVFLNITRNASGVATGIGQDGMLGMALHPNFAQGTGQDSIFIAYTYSSGNARISRFKFNGGASPSLTNETILISGLPASNDHTTGRLIVGADNKLYYSCGDLGNNQFGNRCNLVRSQNDPTSAQLSVNNYSNYSGKILRLNFDGSIPSDNPTFNSVRSHVYSKGHRNPQGLVWQKTASSGSGYPVLETGGKLFSTEHGPRTDDELNIIESGRNYGWPFIAGDSDNVNYQYVNWNSSSSCASTSYTENAVPAGAVITQEKDAPTALKTNFRKPILNMHTTCGSLSSTVCDAGGTNWMRFATIAPSSVDYYNIQFGLAIPSWYPSLLIPTLRKGTLYRVKLNNTFDAVTTDTIPYFRTTNRYRDIALSPDGLKIFIITDSIGSTSGPSGSGTSTLTNRGSILVYQYSGALLAVRDSPKNYDDEYAFAIYPNPAKDQFSIETERGSHKPLSWSLFDATGRRLAQGSFNSNRVTIPCAEYRRGIYIVRVNDNRGNILLLKKIILQ